MSGVVLDDPESGSDFARRRARVHGARSDPSLPQERYWILKPLLVRAITNGRNTIWLDAQHQYAAIALLAVERPALHAVAVIAALAATGRIRTHPTPLRGAAGAAGTASAGLAAAEDRAGREQVRP